MSLKKCQLKAETAYHEIKLDELQSTSILAILH